MEVGKSIPGKARSLVVDSLVPASRWAAAAVHGCSEAGEGDVHPCAEVCRKKRLHTQDAVGKASGGRNRDVLDADSKDRSEGEAAVCASD